MAPAEALFNTTVLLVPLWISGIRYVATRSKFATEEAANIAGVAALWFMFAVLYAMWIAIDQLVAQSGALATGLYVLFIALAGVGIGGTFFVAAQVEKMSEESVIVDTFVQMTSSFFIAISVWAIPPTHRVVWDGVIKDIFPKATVLDVAFAFVFIMLFGKIGDLLLKTQWPALMKQRVIAWNQMGPRDETRED